MQVDDLYGLPLDRFVPERGKLARELRAAGNRDEAAQVAKLRKPSLAAWAVNQLVRTQRRAVRDLFEAGDELRAAHSALLDGSGEGGALRAAAERERAAVGSLVDAARGLLSSEGHELGTAVIDRVADTLHAAALDDEGREQVRAGRLERELRHVGLGMAVVPTRAPRRAAGRRGKTSQKTKPRRTAGPPTEVRATAAAKAAEADARRRAERAKRTLEVSERRRDRAAEALRAADEALAKAWAEAKAAEAEHSRAQRELERAKR